MVDQEHIRGFVPLLENSWHGLIQRLLASVVLVCEWEEAYQKMMSGL